MPEKLQAHPPNNKLRDMWTLKYMLSQEVCYSQLFLVKMIELLRKESPITHSKMVNLLFIYFYILG
jgi:hypothetical protein